MIASRLSFAFSNSDPSYFNQGWLENLTNLFMFIITAQDN